MLLAFELRALMLAGVMMAGGAASAQQATAVRPRILVRVIKVEPSPGAWSGEREQEQWLEVEAVESTAAQFSVGQRVRVGIPLTGGPPLMSKDTPQLSPRVFAPGKLVAFYLGQGCSRENADHQLIVEPNCIRGVAE